MATSGAVTGWLRDLTGSDYATLVAEAAAVPPGAEGLLMLPYFAGERTPLFDPDARGLVHGLTLRHTRGHLYRAALEATAYGVRHNLAAMTEAAWRTGPSRRGRRRRARAVDADRLRCHRQGAADPPPPDRRGVRRRLPGGSRCRYGGTGGHRRLEPRRVDGHPGPGRGCRLRRPLRPLPRPLPGDEGRRPRPGRPPARGRLTRTGWRSLSRICDRMVAFLPSKTPPGFANLMEAQRGQVAPLPHVTEGMTAP